MKKISNQNSKKIKTQERRSLKEKNKVIQELKDKIKKLERRVRFLENELLNILKPVRIRKEPKEVSNEKDTGVDKTLANYKKDFVAKYRKFIEEEIIDE